MFHSIKNMNLANKLTLGRLLGVPLIVILLYFPGPYTCVLSAIVFLAATLTDALDGFVARRYGYVTNFGKFLDPLADKVLICSSLIMLTWLNRVPAWVVVIIISREIAVTGLRALAVDQGIVIAADKYGKWKTVTQSIAVACLIWHYPVWKINPATIGTVFIYVSVLFALFSGWNYFYGFYNELKAKELAKDLHEKDMKEADETDDIE